MTNERTITLSGERDIGICPVCCSDQIEGYDVNYKDGVLSQDMMCLACDTEWIDNYRYVSYTIAYEVNKLKEEVKTLGEEKP